MKKAILISAAKILLVWLFDKAIGYYILKAYQGRALPTEAEVTDVMFKKFYLISGVNILFTVLLYFVLRRGTKESKFVRFVLCVLAFILNVVIVQLS